MLEISTERLMLRPYIAEDRDDYLNLVTDSDVMARIEAGSVTREIAEICWQRLINGSDRGDIRWSARAASDSRYIGHGMINKTRPKNAYENWLHRSKGRMG